MICTQQVVLIPQPPLLGEGGNDFSDVYVLRSGYQIYSIKEGDFFVRGYLVNFCPYLAKFQQF